jgi:hypothetical protein
MVYSPVPAIRASSRCRLADSFGCLPRSLPLAPATAMPSRVRKQAETGARSITNPYWQAQALAAVAGALAKAGRHEQAETVARSITNPYWQARALAAVAKALAARGDTRRAYHVASAACAVGQWTTVLELVLSLEPSALRVLTDL